MTRIADTGLRALCRVLATTLFDLRVDGLRYVPASGPVIIACRHYHYQWDGVLLLAVMPRPISIVVALDWVPFRPMRTVMEAACRLLTWPALLRGDALAARPSGAYVAREEVAYLRQAARATTDLLHSERVVVIFPEGYPNIDPVFTLKRGRHDFLPVRSGFLALAGLAERHGSAPVAILPAGLHYGQSCRRRVRVQLGAPLYLRDFPDREALRRTVEAQIYLLSLGQQP